MLEIRINESSGFWEYEEYEQEFGYTEAVREKDEDYSVDIVNDSETPIMSNPEYVVAVDTVNKEQFFWDNVFKLDKYITLDELNRRMSEMEPDDKKSDKSRLKAKVIIAVEEGLLRKVTSDIQGPYERTWKS